MVFEAADTSVAVRSIVVAVIIVILPSADDLLGLAATLTSRRCTLTVQSLRLTYNSPRLASWSLIRRRRWVTSAQCPGTTLGPG